MTDKKDNFSNTDLDNIKNKNDSIVDNLIELKNKAILNSNNQEKKIKELIIEEPIDSTKCNIDYLLEVRENIDNLDKELISKLLITIDKRCHNNVEFGQFSNELLFMVLEKSPDLFIKTFNELLNDIDTAYIFFDLQNPIHDLIDLKGILTGIKDLKVENESKKLIIKNIEIAEEKY